MKTPRNTSSLFRYQSQLKAGVCAVAALLSVSAWLVVDHLERTETRNAIDGAIAQNVVRAVALEQFVRRTLDAADLAMRDVVQLYRHPGFYAVDRTTGITHIANMGGADTLWSGISIANADGRIVASTASHVAPVPKVDHQDAFRVHRAGYSGRLYVSSPRQSKWLGGEFLWLTRRIDKPDGSFDGVIAINLSPHRLTQLYSAVSAGPADMISVIGLDGVTRARRTGNIASAGEDLNGKLVMRMQMRSPNGTYRGPSGLDGKIRYFSHRRLPEYGLFVTSGVLEQAVLAPVQERIRIYRMAAGLFTLFAAATAAFFLMIMRRRKRLVLEMEESHRRLEQAQRVGKIGDWSLDLENGRSHWSETLLAMYGRTPEQGAPSFPEFLEMLDESGQASVNDAMRWALDSKKPQRYEYTIRNADGIMHHEALAVPVVENGKVVRLYGTDRDVTSERELDWMRARLAHSSRVGAMNAMASTLAHELNQPLAAAQNYLAGTRRSAVAQGNDKLAEGLKMAGQQISFAGDIIRRIRAMVQDQTHPAEYVKLEEAWKDAVMLVMAADRHKRADLATEFEPDARQVYADRVQLQQVFVNLLRNALKATEGQANRRIVASSQANGRDSVHVSVADNGPGFPDGLTDPFAAFARESEAGLGLGLSISRTIIEAHAGRIWAERQDGFTSVHFTLPACPAVRTAVAAE